MGLGLGLGLGLGFGVRVSRACTDAEVVALEFLVVAREVLTFYKRHRDVRDNNLLPLSLLQGESPALAPPRSKKW